MLQINNALNKSLTITKIHNLEIISNTIKSKTEQK